jgi:hypothetical protein
MQRLTPSPVLDAARVRISPLQAYPGLPAEVPTQARLAVLDGRPVYRFAAASPLPLVFADNGEHLSSVPRDMALRAAATFSGKRAEAATFVELLTEADQWTVNLAARGQGPFWKVSWPNGDVVYVSCATGEIAQQTTRGSRFASYFGAIPHWVYFTPLRKDPLLWNRVVTWTSGIGTVMSLLGLVVGIWMYSPSKRYRFRQSGPSSIPFTGQKRWHTILGLVFGTLTCTWIFSGMISMSPFQWLKGTGGMSAVEKHLSGRPLQIAAYAGKHPREALAQVGPELQVKELEFASFAGEPVYLAVEAPGRSRIIPMAGSVLEEMTRNRIVEAVKAVGHENDVAEIRLVKEYETYYVDRHGERPLPVLFVRLNDEEGSTYYIDPRAARIVQSYVVGSRWNRWLYHGLHSIDLPWLYKHRPAWDIFVLLMMCGGTALCVTSVVIGWRRLGKKVSLRRAAQRLSLRESPATK